VVLLSIFLQKICQIGFYGYFILGFKEFFLLGYNPCSLVERDILPPYFGLIYKPDKQPARAYEEYYFLIH
jgi:hypothetical protein